MVKTPAMAICCGRGQKKKKKEVQTYKLFMEILLLYT